MVDGSGLERDTSAARRGRGEDGAAGRTGVRGALQGEAGRGVVTVGSGLVSPGWVAERLSRPGLVLVEVDEEAATHHFSHVPGATFIDWLDCRRALLAPRPQSTAAFEALMSARGIRPDDEVVLYGDAANRYACAVLWLLRHHGHRSLRIMDGGRDAWAAQGLPMTDREAVRTPTRYQAGKAELRVRVTRDELLAQLGEPRVGAALLDCRSPQEFAGQVRHGSSRTPGDLWAERGHLPGAVNLPVTDLLTPDGRLLAPEVLRRVLAGHGVHPGRPVTAYCHTTDRSALVWFVLQEVLGYPSVGVYDGGWQEYGHLLGVPVAGPREADLDPAGAT